jgi:hypothetical protein
MKKILSLMTAFIALATGMTMFALQFTDGNIVVYRVGDGVATLTNRGNVVFLDEYQTNGTFVQSVMLRTNYFGAQSPLIGSGTAFGSGLITRSVDGRFILVNGYGTDLGIFTNTSVQGNFASSVPRVTGLVDGQGNSDTTTTRTNTDFDSVEVRAAVSPDGTNIWTAGDSGGVQYGTRGSLDSTQVQTTLGNVRQLHIFNSQLYFDINNPSSVTQSVVICTNNVPGQLPTATNDVLSSFLKAVNEPSPEGFLMLKLKAGGADPLDTLYVADGTLGHVAKYSLVSGTWVNDGAIAGVQAAVGLTGVRNIIGNQTNVVLYITQGGTTLTGGNNIARVTDTTGYHVAPDGGDLALIVNGTTKKALRGIVLAPTTNSDLALPSGAGRLSVGPAIDVFAKALTSCPDVTETDVFSLANPGTSTILWTAMVDAAWVNLSDKNGTLGIMGNANITVTLGDITGLSAATNPATITFSNKTSVVGTTTRAVTLFLDPQTISPLTDYTALGPPTTGPFTPSNKVYTVKTGPAITLNISKLNNSTWLNLGTTTVSLGACGSTIITASINQAVANTLAVSNYTETIVFSNGTSSVIDTRSVLLGVGFQFFCDDFSTYTQNANLQGQNGWAAVGGSFNEPFVHDGAVWVAATTVQAAGDEPTKNFPQLVATNTPTRSMFCAMSITVTSAAPASTFSPSRIWTFFQSANGVGYARDSLTVRDTGTGGFVFGIRNNGITANTNVFSATARSYGTAYNIIVQGEVGNTNSYVYVNPPNGTLNTANADVKMTLVSGSDFNVGSAQIGNTFDNAAFNYQAGIAISKMCVTTNYTDAFNDLPTGGPSDPFTTWQTFYFPADGPNAAPNADPDHDGMSNTNEFLAGFNPTNNAARLKITSIVRTDGTNVTITYLGASGDSASGRPSSYANVLYSTTGTPPSYTNNFVSTGQTNVLSGGTGLGQTATFVHTNGATGPARYYRVRVLIP